MFIPGSAHISRRLQLGKSINLETMAMSRHFIEIMIGLWGDVNLELLGVDMVMPWLFQDRRSGSWKNYFLGILREVFLEAPWHGCHVQPPIFQRFADNYKKADIFSTEELDMLFKHENFPSELFYLFYLLCLSGGMRLGEVRAIRAKQIIFDKKIIIIDGFCKRDGRRTDYNKKGTPDNPKFRLVFLPDLTLNKMAEWIDGQHIGPEDFCFSVGGRPITPEKAEKVFYEALLKSGIIPVPEYSQGRKKLKPPDDRKLVPHSLRYTFVSRMRRELSAVELLPMTGHTTVKMVDYYNRKVLDLALAGLPKTGAAAANTLFA
jgi:integrase